MKGLGLAITLVAAALAVALVWNQAEPETGEPFQRPGVVDIVHPDGVGTARDLVSGGGRITARKPVELVYRWLLAPDEVEVTEPAGTLELRLGDPGVSSGALRIGPEQLTLLVGNGRVAIPETGSRVGLRFDGERYQALVDGEPVGDPLVGPRPGGPGRIRLTANSSFRSFTCRTEADEARSIDGGVVISPTARRLWAGLSAALGVLCLAAWWRTLTAGGRARTGGWVLGALVSVVLLYGTLEQLRTHNRDRFGPVPGPCATQPLLADAPITVVPGRPFDAHPRRDGDFTLSMTVMLEEGSVLDVLLRGSPPDRDTGVLLTLSADYKLQSGLAVNHGVSFDATPGPAWLGRLQPDEPHTVHVTCRGPDTIVVVDDDPLAHVRDWDLRAGRLAFLALSGRATIEDLHLQPLGPPTGQPGVLRRWLLMAGAGLALGLMLLALVAGRGPGGLLWSWPLAVAVSPWAPPGSPVFGLLGAALLLLLTPPPGRRLASWLLGAALMVLCSWAVHEQPPPTARGVLNALSPADIAGLPVPRYYAWARHPLIRRFNSYVRNQQFRDGPIDPVKPEGTTRILALGSSSTFGYGVPAADAFATQLERRLLADGYAVETINCGVPGATAERLRSLLESVLLGFEPDVVIIDLAFNDHIQNAGFDERAHFDAMTTTGIGVLGALWAKVAERVRVSGWARYFERFKKGEPVDGGDERRFSLEPAQRFAATLRDMVTAARAAGAEVVLVAEPYNSERGRTPIEPFHLAMAALAAELGTPFVAPQAALAGATEPVFVDTVHPNRAGHAIIAEQLRSALEAADLLRR